MAVRCPPASMKAFMAELEVQSVAVQKVLWRSASTLVATLPGVFAAWRAERSASQPNIGKNRQERTRNRVMEMKNMLFSVRAYDVGSPDVWAARLPRGEGSVAARRCQHGGRGVGVGEKKYLTYSHIGIC